MNVMELRVKLNVYNAQMMNVQKIIKMNKPEMSNIHFIINYFSNFLKILYLINKINFNFILVIVIFALLKDCLRLRLLDLRVDTYFITIV